MIDKPISNMTVAELIRFMQGILATRNDDVVAPAMAAYAFTDENYDAGEAHLETFVDSVSAFAELVGRESEAITARNAHLDTFRAGDFEDHVGRVRVVVGASGPDADRLRLPGLTSDLSIAEWLERSQHFYTTLSNDTELMAHVQEDVGLTPAMVQGGQDAVHRALDLDTSYQNLVTRRQQARRDRDEKRTPVEAWARRAKDIARMALKDNEAQEIFGIRYYSEEA